MNMTEYTRLDYLQIFVKMELIAKASAFCILTDQFMGISKKSKTFFSLWGKVGMRDLKSNIYNPHPSPPSEEGG
jgi:hypothetical protein